MCVEVVVVAVVLVVQYSSRPTWGAVDEGPHEAGASRASARSLAEARRFKKDGNVKPMSNVVRLGTTEIGIRIS